MTLEARAIFKTTTQNYTSFSLIKQHQITKIWMNEWQDEKWSMFLIVFEWTPEVRSFFLRFWCFAWSHRVHCNLTRSSPGIVAMHQRIIQDVGYLMKCNQFQVEAKIQVNHGHYSQALPSLDSLDFPEGHSPCHWQSHTWLTHSLSGCLFTAGQTSTTISLFNTECRSGQWHRGSFYLHDHLFQRKKGLQQIPCTLSHIKPFKLRKQNPTSWDLMIKA